MYMSNFLRVVLTIILFLISLNYTNKVIDYFQNKDPLMQEIIDKKDDYYQKPIDAIITKNFVIQEKNGQQINIKKSYNKMKKLGSFNESLLAYETIVPKKTYVSHFDKVIIPKIENNNIILIFDINNDKALFTTLNQILKKNNIVANVINSNFNLDDTSFKYIFSTNYIDNTDYCISYNQIVNSKCQNNKKYTILIKKNIINNNFLINTKKAIDNHNNIIIYCFNVNNINNLNIILKYLRNNRYHISNIFE